MMKVGLIDYGAGNLQSVRNALQSLGRECGVVDRPEALSPDIGACIFPGVGAFGDSMRTLRARGLEPLLNEWIREGRPFLGICIGYQVLFADSEENPGVRGLAIFPGRVIRMRAPGLKVPHMGWNEVRLRHPNDPLWDGLGPAPHAYFVHSFHPVPDDDGLVAATTEYGSTFASAIRWRSGAAVQFHPEKSQAVGLRLIDNFVRLAEDSALVPR